MQMFFSAGFILLIVLWGIFAPDNMAAIFDTLLAALTRNFGWLYLWVVLAMVVFAAYAAFSRYGNLKLGAEDDEPEFGIGSWFAMLFAAGMGIGLVFWGVAEPLVALRHGASRHAGAIRRRRRTRPCAMYFSTGASTPGPCTAWSRWRSPSSSTGAAPVP